VNHRTQSKPTGPLGDSDELEGHVALLDMCMDLIGPCHPQTLTAAKGLGIAFWRAGYADRAIDLLEETIARATKKFGADHPARLEPLCLLGGIMLEQQHLEQSAAIFREIVECCTRRSGANHPSSLAAKGDLAHVLFELGEAEEAGSLEREAFASARTHLGRSHPVTTVLAWNCALRCKKQGDPDSARSIVVTELVWLLAEDPASLDADQNAIRTVLSEELNWDTARSC
jgi:hypothetical protein